MIKKIFFPITAVFFLLSSPAFSSEWVYVISLKNVHHYIDFESIDTDDSHVTYWSKFINGDTKAETKNKWTINCTNGTATLRELIQYSSDGAIGESYKYEDNLEWKEITPDTIVASFKKLLCNTGN